MTEAPEMVGHSEKTNMLTMRNPRTPDPAFAAVPSSFAGSVGSGNLLCHHWTQEQSAPEGVVQTFTSR